jgi:hypothetical protein
VIFWKQATIPIALNNEKKPLKINNPITRLETFRRSLLESFQRRLTTAFKKMQTDIEISFNEEYALETLWHEMMHTRALHTDFPSKNVMVATEGIHQWLSRRSYQQLLTKFDVKPIHQDSIIRNGLAYQNEVDNFNALLSILAVQGSDVVSDIERLWLSGVSAQEAKAQVALLLAQKSQIRDSRINKAFNYLSIESVDFVAKAKKIISY